MEEANLQWRYVDGNLIMPWYVLDALKWLKEQDVKSWKVFEYGCGYSTIWWRVNCLELKSVDSESVWANAMAAIHECEKELYIKSCLNQFSTYDCIVVDGDFRDECVEFCIPFLKSGGYIIIDNYEQPSVGYDFTKTNLLLEGWEKQVYKQYNHTDWQTAIFKKP